MSVRRDHRSVTYAAPVRIAQLIPRGEQPSSGVLTVIMHLSAALANRGHGVYVVQGEPWSTDRYRHQLDVLDASGVQRVIVPRMTVSTRAAASVIRSLRCDLVHLHGGFNPWNTRVARSLTEPFVYSPHSAYDRVSLRRSRYRKQLFAWLFERETLRRSALVVALTDAEHEDIDAFGWSRRIEVIPNGVVPAPADIDRTSFRNEIGLGTADQLCVFVGRLDVYRKGLDVLVQALTHAPHWHLALVGPSFRDVDVLEREIETYDVGRRIHRVGERHGRELMQAVAAADVFALMSRWEGLPMALLEALSLGIPAVVSAPVERAVGVDAAGAGWMVSADRLGEWLGSVDPDDIARRGRAARRLSERFDWTTIAARYEAAYESALAKA